MWGCCVLSTITLWSKKYLHFSKIYRLYRFLHLNSHCLHAFALNFDHTVSSTLFIFCKLFTNIYCIWSCLDVDIKIFQKFKAHNIPISARSNDDGIDFFVTFYMEKQTENTILYGLFFRFFSWHAHTHSLNCLNRNNLNVISNVINKLKKF